MKKITIFFLGWFVISALLFPTDSSGSNSPKHQLIIRYGQVSPSSMIRWGATIEIQKGGCINGSLFLVNSRLVLDGEISEDVICFSSDLDIRENAVIKGDLLIIGGSVQRNPSCRVTGKDIYIELDLQEIERSLLPVFFDSQSVALFKAIKILFWLVITLLVFAAIPMKINTAEAIFENHTIKLGLTGLFSLLGFLLLTIMFIILSLFYVGIPLLFLLVVFYAVVYILGRTVMFYFIGIKLTERLKIKNITPAFYILIGIIVYSIFKFIPIIGPILLLIMNVFEVGIGVGFIFRKKLKLKA